jgi:large subunit ribosomal protein L22
MAILRHARISPPKVRQVARVLKGKSAAEGCDLLRFIPRKSAQIIRKVLSSAIANAENNAGQPVERLRIANVLVEEGVAFRRHIPAARGSAHPIRKRTSHIKVVLREE